MGATASSAQRDSRCEEDVAAEEEITAAASDAREDGSADDKLLQKNGQISNLNVKTRSHADELNVHFEEKVLADVDSGFAMDGTETTEDLQEIDALPPIIKNESTEMVNVDGEEPEEDNQVNDINEVGFKKVFRFVGFKFTLKKDPCEKTEANEKEERVTSPSEDSNDTQENSAVAANEDPPDETHNTEASSEPDAAEPSRQTDNETEMDLDIKTVEHHVEDTPDKEMAKECPEMEEQMSPIKQFFTQGIFASLRKKKKEEEIQKESKEEELKRIEKVDAEEAEHEDSKCMCLDIPYIISEEEKDSVEKADDKLLPEGDLLNILEKDKVQGSPLKRLFRKFSTRRQRESKASEKVIEAEEQVSEQPKPCMKLSEHGKVEGPVILEPKPAEEELVADVSPQESKKKSDTTVSWEALICGGSAKKRARKTNEDETADGKEEENEKTTDSPLGSSFEGDYDHLTSSNEQTGSPAEGETASTWKTFKKMVTPKRKVRTGESSTPEQIHSDSEINKDDSFSRKKLTPGHKKRKSEARKEQTSSDEAAKDHETGDEDDETPAIIPLSEFEIIEPESFVVIEPKQRVEITIEHEMPEMTSQVLEQDTSNDLVPEITAKISSNTGPTVIYGLSEDFEELTDFVSKHQQLSDIPEEGIIEETIETPVSSTEWTTQDNTLAEDIVELTADAVTAPEPESEQFNGDDTTEMVSAVSQLTESPRTSGHVTPVPAEYDVQTSDVILHEAIQSICMSPSVQSVTTKDEKKESLAMSCSPYIVQLSTPEKTKVLVAHKKTEATAICTGLVSQEIESVEEHLPAQLVEAIPEVSDAVPTELISDNFTDEPEAAGLGTDEVYEAEIKDVKTEYQNKIVNEEESASETQLDIEEVVKLVEEPLVKESEVNHMEDKTEECTTDIELRQTIDTMQSEAGLDQVMSESPETVCPLYPELEEPVYEQTLSEQAALTEVVETLTHGVVDNIPVSKTSDVHEEEIEMIASAEECLESKETITIISPSSDHIVAATLELEENVKVKEVESILVDDKDAVLIAGDSAVTVDDISEKMEENNDGKQIHVEKESDNVVASEVVRNIAAENIPEAVDESLAREQLLDKEVSLPESVLVDEADELHKDDIGTDMDNSKVEDSGSDRTDRVLVKEEEELAVKEGQSLANTESNETDNQDVSAQNTTDESPEINVDAGTGHGEMVQEIREHTFVPEFSKDVFEHTETPEQLRTSCEVVLTPLETALPEVEAGPVPTEIVVSQTEECNEQPVITENIKTGKVLEMVAIIENTTKQSGKEKLLVVEPVAQGLTISELPKTTEQEGDASEMTVVHVVAIDGDQAPESFDSGLTMIEVAATTVLEQSSTATQMEVSNVSEHKNEADDDAKLKCEPLELLIEANELQLEQAKINDEILAVTEVTPIAHLAPLSSEVTADVSVSEIQTQAVSELRAVTLEVTEPKVEMAVETEVKVETTVVTELEVEMPVVTSMVKELEVDMPVVTSMAKTTDTHNSVATLQNQNLDTDTSVLTTVIKQQMEEMPAVVSVVVTPATPLDEVTPVVTLGNESKIVAPVENTPVATIAAETPNVESVIVTTAVAPVVEIQNVIPVGSTPDLDSVKEAASSVLSAATVTIVAESGVVKTVVETPVIPFIAVKSTPALVEEMPAVIEKINVPTVVEIPVVQTPTVGPLLMPSALTSVAEIQTVASVTETVPSEEVTLDVTSFAETPVSQVIETPVVSITSAKPTVVPTTQTSVVEKAAITVTETVSSVVATSSVTPVAVTPVVETSAVSSITVAETSPVTTLVERPAQISVIVTDAAPQVTPAATSVAETSAVIPVVEIPVVKSIPVAVVETPVATPVVETPSQVSLTVTETASTIVCSAVTTAVGTPVGTSVVKSIPVAVVETPVATPVVETPDPVSLTVTETASTIVCSAVTTAVGPPVVTSVVKSIPVAVVETPDPVSLTVTETASTIVCSAVTTAVGPPVGTSVVKSIPIAVVETPVATPVVETPDPVLLTVTETASTIVCSAVTTAVGTPVVTSVVKSIPVAVVETPDPVSLTVTETASTIVCSAVTTAVGPPVGTSVVKSIPIAVVETPVATPVVETPSKVSLIVTETASTIVCSEVTTAVGPPVVETPLLKSAPLAEVETAVLTSAVQTPHQVIVTVTEAAAPGVVSSVNSAAETPVVIQVVETPQLKSTPVAVVETPVLTPAAPTPHQVIVTATEAAAPIVVSPVTSVAETPVVIPVVENPVVKPTPIALAETPVVTPVMMTSTVTPIAERSVVSLVQDTTVGAPITSVPVAETPVMIPVVQTPALVIVKEAPVVLPSVTAVAEVSVVSPVVETLAVKPTVAVVPVAEALSVSPVVQTPVVEQIAQTPMPAVPLVKVTPIGTVIETPPVTTVENAPQKTSVAQTTALAPLMVTPAIGQVVGSAAAVLFVVTPEVKEAMLQVVEQEKKEANAEPSVVSKNVEPLLVAAKEVKTAILPEEIATGSLQHETVTSPEPQSEVEDDVWEDAVDNIGDSQGLALQDTSAKQAPDAAI